MELHHLLNAARIIVARNVTPQVRRATVNWSASQKKLVLCYFTRQPPSEDDVEECELAMTELIAEFPDVADCETSCTQEPKSIEPTTGLVVYEAT